MSDYRRIIGSMDRIHLLRKIIMNTDPVLKNELYFGQLPILEYVIRHEGCTQKEVADFIGVTPASIALSTKRLQKAGLIRKETDDANLRCNQLFPTEQGRALSMLCRQRFDALDERTFRGFSEAEIGVLQGFLDRMLSNVGEEQYRHESIFRLASFGHHAPKEEQP